LDQEKEKNKQLNYIKFSSGEKYNLISIEFQSFKKDIVNFHIIVKDSELFSNVEKILYEYYPQYKNTNSYFKCGENRLDRNKTLKDNKIINNSTIFLKNHENLDLNNQINSSKTFNNISSGEKFVKIYFNSMSQDIDQGYYINARISDSFSEIENKLYEKYPSYKKTKSENFFLANGELIKKNLTIQENKIEDGVRLLLDSNIINK
jgi:hypothetical protein